MRTTWPIISFPAMPFSCSSDHSQSLSRHLVSTNDVPTSDETATLHQVMIAANTEIEKRQAIIQKLNDEMSPYLSTRNVVKNILSPIRRVPAEIWAEIFIAALHPTAFHYSSNAPLVFLSVSMQWRSIVLTIPRLWASLRFNAHNPPSDPNLVGKWLKRAGSLPLSVAVYVGRDHKPAADSLKDIFRYADRVISLEMLCHNSINGPSSDVFAAIASNSSFPNLKEFTLEWHPRSPVPSMPSLKKLSLNFRLEYEAGASFLDFRPQIPFGSLTELSIESTFDECFQLLPICTQLVRFTWTQYQDTDDLFDRLPLVMLHLTDLFIHFNEETPEFLNCFTLPKLERLTLLRDMDCNDVPVLPTEFLDLMNRSKCKLQSLSLAGMRFDFLSFLAWVCADQCKNISRLQINSCPGVLFALNDSRFYSDEEDAIMVLPLLKELIVEDDWTVETGLALPFVESRLNGPEKDARVAVLESVTFGGYAYSPQSIEERDWQSQGLQVYTRPNLY